MPKNHFRKNRIRIQQAVLDLDFLVPLNSSDVPFSIIEKKAQAGKLREVIIHNIPTEETPRPKSWILELEETTSPIFSKPPRLKTVEKALIVLGSDELSVFLFEMKNSLQPFGEDGVIGIRKKIEDSIGRISFLLPLYIFGKDYNDIKIQYKGIIFYNHNNSFVSAIQENEEVAKSDFARAFQNDKSRIFLSDPLGGAHEVELYFFQNSDYQNSPESFSVNFEQFFLEEWKYNNSVYGDMTCPIIKKLPTE